MSKIFVLFLLLASSVFAGGPGGEVDLTMTWVGFSGLAIFIIGYYFVAMEEKYHLDKAKPALFMGTFIISAATRSSAVISVDARSTPKGYGLP